MSFYRYKDVSWAQCQASGFWLHVGNTILGWVRLDYRQKNRPLWLGLSFNTPAHYAHVKLGRGLGFGIRRRQSDAAS